MILNSLRFVVLMDLLLFFALQNHGCTGGKVIDEYGLPVIGAKAVCDDLPASGPVFSDGTGMYKWPDSFIPEGPHSFTISMYGFEPVTVKAVVKYGVAPGHIAAEGLVFQVPDVRLRRPSAAARGQSPAILPPPNKPPPAARVSSTEPESTTTLQKVPAALFPELPPMATIPVPSTSPPAILPRIIPNTTLAQVPIPTFPPLTVSLPTTTAVPYPKVPATVDPAARTTAGVSPAGKDAAPVPPALPPVAPPGQQWYQSPDEKYSFSAPMSWKVGFQGNKAVIQYEKSNCALVQIIMQVNDSGRPRGKVIKENSTLFSGIDVQVRTYDTGAEGYFFSCGGDQFALFKSRPGNCEAPGVEAAEQEAMLILTSMQCRL